MVRGDVNDSLKEALWLWRAERLDIRKELVQMISLRLLVRSNFVR